MKSMTSMGTESCRPDSRIERLLGCFQKAFSHELPNQLIAIQGLVQLLDLEARTRLNDEGGEMLDRLAAASKRTHELVRFLAELGRISVARQMHESVSVKEVAQEAAASVNPLVPEAVIEYHFPNPSPRVKLDRRGLHQIMVHLLLRAARPARQKGPGPVQVGARSRDEGLEVWVANNGPGLTDEECRQALEPFAGDHGQDPAKGLGLFLVSQWVDAWGGTFRVESPGGQRALFTVIVPGDFV